MRGICFVKAIAWVSWSQTSQVSKALLEQGLINENILDLPEDQRPEVINDRGRQVKAKSIKKMFEDHHMPQLFARPRTPMIIYLLSPYLARLTSNILADIFHGITKNICIQVSIM